MFWRSHLHTSAQVFFGFLFLALIESPLLAQGLPTQTDALFSGSGNCAICHISDGISLRDSNGTDLSMPTDWRSTMMANAAKDPLWQAKVESEVSENPELQAEIEDACTTCHAPMGRTTAIRNGAEGYSLAEMRNSPLALDGVSCTVCHQIQPDNLGLDESYSGGYIIDDSRLIFGPYDAVLQGPMQQIVDYTPLFGAQMQESEICATCHTLFTPIRDTEGNVIGSFPEQVVYLEWLNSTFAGENGVPCQDCHMPLIYDPVSISSIPRSPTLRSPFWRHYFVGGNAFMLRILRDNGTEIGVTANSAQFDTTINRTLKQLRYTTARMETQATVLQDTLVVDVAIENLSGHKFPTGYPARRAWLHILVEETDTGEIVFESGAFDIEGRIAGMDTGFETHYDRITSESQVQVYESVLGDGEGAPTHSLLRAASYLKDNRLPPAGFVSTAPRYDDMAIHGAAENDPNFNRQAGIEGSGRDNIQYRIDVAGRNGTVRVLVELLYQSVKPEFLDNLFTHDTEAVDTFAGYYDSADKTPAVVQSEEGTVDIVTGIADGSPDVPRQFALQQNYPNPFNGSTIIPYSISDGRTTFELSIFDLRGRHVRTLVQGRRSAGDYTIQWDGRDDSGISVSSGVYIYRLRTVERAVSRKLIYLR